MALTIDLEASECLTFADALEHAALDVKAQSFDDLVKNARILKALANNRSFLKEIIDRDICHALRGEQTSIYTPQSILLGSSGSINFRANFWIMPTQDPSRRDFETSLYSYGTAHDHNFNFLTIGYWGPGYSTDIYEYDREKVAGYVGEKVAIRFLETTSLSQGKMMAYRSGKDIHTQAPPDSFSISINMMAIDHDELSKPQFFFDLKAGTIIKLLDNDLASDVSLIRLAKYIGDDETRELLGELTDRRFAPFVRAAAYDAILANVSGEEEEKVRHGISHDPDESMERRVVTVSRM